MKKKAGMIAVILIYAAVAVIIAYLIILSGNYPTGTDTLGYLYKGNMLYDAMGKGDWYPLYDSLWFNGVHTATLCRFIFWHFASGLPEEMTSMDIWCLWLLFFIWERWSGFI